MKKTSVAVICLAAVAFLVFAGAFAVLTAGIFYRGIDPDRLLPAAYVMAGAFVVLVPCLLYRVYVKFDRKYRSETNPNQNQTEEKQ